MCCKVALSEHAGVSCHSYSCATLSARAVIRMCYWTRAHQQLLGLAMRLPSKTGKGQKQTQLIAVTLVQLASTMTGPQ